MNQVDEIFCSPIVSNHDLSDKEAEFTRDHKSKEKLVKYPGRAALDIKPRRAPSTTTSQVEMIETPTTTAEDQFRDCETVCLASSLRRTEEQNKFSSLTVNQLKERMEHRQRLADGVSDPRLVVPSIHVFPQVYPEFSDCFTKEQYHVLEKDFLLSDLDQDGVLNRTEVKYWMEKRVQPINERQLQALLCNCDQDKDEALSFREFLYLCKHVQFQDFNQSFHKNHVFVAKKSQELMLQEGPDLSPSPQNKLPLSISKRATALGCENTDQTIQNSASKQAIKQGQVKQAVQFFNERIHQEAEVNRKQMESLPKKKHGRDSSAHKCKCPPPPPQIPPNPTTPTFELKKSSKSSVNSFKTEGVADLPDLTSSTALNEEQDGTPPNAITEHDEEKVTPLEKIISFKSLSNLVEEPRTVSNDCAEAESPLEADDDIQVMSKVSEPAAEPNDTSSDCDSAIEALDLIKRSKDSLSFDTDDNKCSPLPADVYPSKNEGNGEEM